MDDLIRAILKREGLNAHTIEPLSGGQVNRVFGVDGEWVLRIGMREDAHARLEHETALLQSLEGKVPAPRIHAFGQLDGHTYQIQRFVPGQKLYAVWRDLDPLTQERIVAELAGYLDVLHSRTFDTFGYAREGAARFPDWAGFLLDKFQHTLAEIEALGLRMAPGFIDLAAAYVEQHKDALQEGVPALVHGDLTLVNVLVHAGRVSALLDFEYALHAPRDYELWTVEAFCLYPNDWAEEDNEIFCAADYARFAQLLEKHAPGLFAAPRLRERLNIYHLDAALGSNLAWRKDNLATLPPDQMAVKEFYMARIANFIFRHGVRMFCPEV